MLCLLLCNYTDVPANLGSPQDPDPQQLVDAISELTSMIQTMDMDLTRDCEIQVGLDSNVGTAPPCVKASVKPTGSVRLDPDPRPGSSHTYGVLLLLLL